jgi:hypothetical protein
MTFEEAKYVIGMFSFFMVGLPMMIAGIVAYRNRVK